MEQWIVVFQTAKEFLSMIEVVAALALLIKRDRDDTDDRDKRR